MLAFILAGGQGLRLKEMLPAHVPKPMASIAGKPVLQHQIEFLAQNGMTRVVLSVGPGAQLIRQYFGDGRPYGLSIQYSEESRPLGTAGALKYAETLLGSEKDILVLYGDIILDIDWKRFINFHNAHRGIGTLLVHPNDHPNDSDLLEIDPAGRVINFFPKPRRRENYFQNLVNAGMYLFRSEILSFIENGRPQDFGRDILPRLVGNKKILYAYKTSEYVKDMGSPKRYYQVTKDMLSGKVYRKNLVHRQKAIFMDRDGVINREVHYVCRPEDFELLDGSAAAIREINKSDFLGIVVTNQSAVARGFCSLEDIHLIHKKMDSCLGRENAFLDALYYCPHHPDDNLAGGNRQFQKRCNCRKPKTGMIQKALIDFNIDTSKSFMIGDGTVDIMTGRNAGLKTILVRTGQAGQDKKYEIAPDFVFENLQEAVHFLVDDYERWYGQIMEIITPLLSVSPRPVRITVGGLARAGKSTISKIISFFLKERGLDAVILDLDDWIVDLENRRPAMSVRERYDNDRLERIFDLF